MYLDDTYFRGELYLPNLVKADNSQGKAAILQTVGENNLLWFIEKYEDEALDLIIGKDLKERMSEGLRGDDPGRWERLRDQIFRKGDYGSFSPVANYVYCQVLRSGKTQTSMSGEVRKRTDAMSVAHVRDKFARAWNGMGKMIGDIHLYVMNNDYGIIPECVLCWFKPINTFDL